MGGGSSVNQQVQPNQPPQNKRAQRPLPQGNFKVDIKNKLPQDVLEAFTQILKQAGMPPKSTNRVQQRQKPPQKNPPAKQPPRKEESKVVQQVQPPEAKPVEKKEEVTNNANQESIVQQAEPQPIVAFTESDPIPPKEEVKEEKFQGKVIENFVEDSDDGARYSPEPPRPESPQISEEADESIAYNLREKTAEQHRLAQEEAKRQAAELRKKQEDDLMEQKNQLANIEGKASDILSKYA